MGNYTATRPYIYVTGTTIDPNQNNPNENEIYLKHNQAINATTGHGHTGAIGDAPRIGDTGIAWGVAAGQVNAVDMPIIDTGGFFPTDNVNAALQDLASGVVPVPIHTHIDNTEGGPLSGNAIQSDITGTGSVVKANSPTIVTPTVASLTNMQHAHQNAAGGGTLDAAAIAAGTLPVARGGTGTTTSTGTGDVVLSGSPTLTTPTLTTPVIGNYTSGQHDHSNAANGGPINVTAFTGVLPVANGGTGVTTSTGTGSVMLGTGGTRDGAWVDEWDGTPYDRVPGTALGNRYKFSMTLTLNPLQVTDLITLTLSDKETVAFFSAYSVKTVGQAWNCASVDALSVVAKENAFVPAIDSRTNFGGSAVTAPLVIPTYVVPQIDTSGDPVIKLQLNNTDAAMTAKVVIYVEYIRNQLDV